MNTLNRRDMIQLSAAGSLGAVIGDVGFSAQKIAADALSAEAQIKTRMFWTWDRADCRRCRRQPAELLH